MTTEKSEPSINEETPTDQVNIAEVAIESEEVPVEATETPGQTGENRVLDEDFKMWNIC